MVIPIAPPNHTRPPVNNAHCPAYHFLHSFAIFSTHTPNVSLANPLGRFALHEWILFPAEFWVFFTSPLNYPAAAAPLGLLHRLFLFRLVLFFPLSCPQAPRFFSRLPHSTSISWPARTTMLYCCCCCCCLLV